MADGKKIKNVCSCSLLITFVFGALVFLQYRSLFNIFFDKSDAVLPMVFLTLLLLESFNVSSITALVVMPLMSALFGMSTAAAIFRLGITGSAEKIDFFGALPLLLLVPLNFVVCGTGMTLCMKIRSVLYLRRGLYRQSTFATYSIMFISLMLFGLTMRHIIYI